MTVNGSGACLACDRGMRELFREPTAEDGLYMLGSGPGRSLLFDCRRSHLSDCRGKCGHPSSLVTSGVLSLTLGLSLLVKVSLLVLVFHVSATADTLEPALCRVKSGFDDMTDLAHHV